MRISQLFEIDPELGRMLGKAARGVGDAGDELKGPLTVSDVQGRVEKGIDDLEKEMQKYPQQQFNLGFNRSRCTE